MPKIDYTKWVPGYFVALESEPFRPSYEKNIKVVRETDALFFSLMAATRLRMKIAKDIGNVTDPAPQQKLFAPPGDQDGDKFISFSEWIRRKKDGDK